MSLTWADGCIGVKLPGINEVNSGFKKSTWPPQFEAIIGFLVWVNYNNGLPNHSPLVKLTIALILEWLYKWFTSSSDISPWNR